MTAPSSGWVRPLWAVAVLTLAWLTATAWARPLMLPDEGRYVGVAWEMLQSGNWLTPTLNGLPYFHKPPLFYWITAASMSVLGANEWAARTAPLLGAWVGAMAMFLFVRRWVGQTMAGATTLVLLVQPLFFLGGQFANLDMLVAGCITATVLCGAHAALNIEQGLPYRHALALGYVGAALGVLAKGLIGVVLPAAVLLVWLVLLRRWRVLARLLWWPGLGLFALLASPWFVAMQMRYPGFLDYFFVVQHFKRFAAGGFNNAEPFWFYPAALALLSLPWLPWLVRVVRHGDSPSPLRWLMGVWAVVVVAFFSLPASKLIGYVLPAVPPLAFLMTDGLATAWATSSRVRNWAWAGAAVSALTGWVAVGVLAVHTPHSSRELAAALAARLGPGPREPVFALDHYPFDLRFYARLQSPVVVVADWAADKVAQRDDWRKELGDAGRFAPRDAASVLVPPTAWPARLCLSPVNWVVAAPSAQAEYAFLAQGEAVVKGREAWLWRLRTEAVSQLGCWQKPSADSPDR